MFAGKKLEWKLGELFMHAVVWFGRLFYRKSSVGGILWAGQSYVEGHHLRQ